MDEKTAGTILIYALSFILLLALVALIFLWITPEHKSPPILFQGNPKDAYIKNCGWDGKGKHEWINTDELIGEITCYKRAWIWEPSPWEE